MSLKMNETGVNISIFTNFFNFRNENWLIISRDKNASQKLFAFHVRFSKKLNWIAKAA